MYISETEFCNLKCILLNMEKVMRNAFHPILYSFPEKEVGVT